jgi:hypothetical protein
MFIATRERFKISLRQERNPAAEPAPRQAKAIALLTELRSKETTAKL